MILGSNYTKCSQLQSSYEQKLSEWGEGREGRLEAGEEGEDVVSGGETEVGLLDPVNTNTHKSATATLTRLLQIIKQH